jgi:hypothetical protein
MIKGIEMNPNNLEKQVTVLAEPSAAPTQVIQAVAASGSNLPEPLVPARHLVHAPAVSVPSLDHVPSTQAAAFTYVYNIIKEKIKIKAIWSFIFLFLFIIFDLF